MSVSVEKLTDMPVVLCTMDENYNPVTDLPTMDVDAARLLELQAVPQFLIVDTTYASIGLDDLISGSNIARQMKIPKHPNVRESIVITNSRLIELGVKGMNTATFGHIAVKSFASLEAALSYVRRVSSNPTSS